MSDMAPNITGITATDQARSFLGHGILQGEGALALVHDIAKALVGCCAFIRG